MNVYFISGLAADSRVFMHIRLPAGFHKHHLHWIDPQPRETLQSYSYRLAEAIDTSQPFILIGLSMGGMIATEIAARFPPVSLILISSISSYKQLSPVARMCGRLNLHRIVPVGLLKSLSILKRDFYPDSKSDKKILRQVISDSNPKMIKWALNAIVNWRGEAVVAPVCHVHGDKDEVLPMRYTTPTHVIPGGNHLMIMNQAEKINEILAEVLPLI